MAAHPESREGQRVLAGELTALVHGAAAAEASVAASEALFGPGDLRALDAATLEAAAADLPRAVVALPLPGIVDLLVASGLARSRGEGRRALEQGGVYLNNDRLNADEPPGPGALLHGRWLLLRRGKRSIAVVQVETTA